MVEGPGDTFYIYIVSDGTGETAVNLVRALITQFSKEQRMFTRRYAKVTTSVSVDRVLENARNNGSPVFVAYTLVNSELRTYLRNRLFELGIPGYDLFTTFLAQLSGFLGAEPEENPDKFHGISEKYFKRMAAVEFTFRHDDGKLLEGMDEADIVLVGVSRTGKTPLSMYLALYGHRVINIPLAKGVRPPEKLNQIDQKKIIGLTIDPQRLAEIRRERMTGLKVVKSQYCNPGAVLEEIEEAAAFFRKHRRWPLIDVTNRSIEETAVLVRDKVFGRDRLLT